jgi:myo-inositol-1(or 4)-monophosphatase
VTDADPEALRQLAVTVARAAGELLLEARRGGGALDELGAAATRKSSATDLATAADRASEQLVLDRLLAARPDDGLIGEEGSSRAGTSGLTWIVDPLDGTTNFVYDYPGWAVSIAVADGVGPLAGAVHDPQRGETFSAARGGGAWLGPVPITRNPAPPLPEALVGTGFSYASERRAEQARLLPVVLPAVRDLRRGGSAALDLCSVALGRLDAFYEAELKPWDRAAGLLVASESGVGWRDLDGIIAGGTTLVVAPPELLDAFVALLERAAPAA